MNPLILLAFVEGFKRPLTNYSKVQVKMTFMGMILVDMHAYGNDLKIAFVSSSRAMDDPHREPHPFLLVDESFHGLPAHIEYEDE